MPCNLMGSCTLTGFTLVTRLSAAEAVRAAESQAAQTWAAQVAV